MRRSLDLLRTRLGELDESLNTIGPALAESRLEALLARFVDVLSSYTNTFMDAEAGVRATIDPAEADGMVAASRLLKAVGAAEPSLVDGPLAVDRQHWTSINWWGREHAAGPIPPSSGRFNAPDSTTSTDAGPKPFHLGLYTSTAIPTGIASWRLFLDPYQGSELYSFPWHTWQLVVDRDARIAEIGSAQAWADFVERFGAPRGDLVVPQWRRVAEELDAVHVTLPAIAAAQGFHLPTRDGLIPPVFWDVEATFWLRWRFTDSRLVESLDD